MRAVLALASLGAALLSGASFAQRANAPAQGSARLRPVARFGHQVTGATVSPDGRNFVNFPRRTEDAPVSIAEVMRDGSIKPYPNDEWNAWRKSPMNLIMTLFRIGPLSGSP